MMRYNSLVLEVPSTESSLKVGEVKSDDIDISHKE